MVVHSELAAETPSKGLIADQALTKLSAAGEVEIAGRVYLTAPRLAEMLGVTVRTVGRWNAARIGPPKIKIGKVVLYELSQLPEWLSSRATVPVRARSH
jgi:predicted DNA-binding transcriptional regulator AlpA